jgi:hypothetical protein
MGATMNEPRAIQVLREMVGLRAGRGLTHEAGDDLLAYIDYLTTENERRQKRIEELEAWLAPIKDWPWDESDGTTPLKAEET